MAFSLGPVQGQAFLDQIFKGRKTLKRSDVDPDRFAEMITHELLQHESFCDALSNMDSQGTLDAMDNDVIFSYLETWGELQVLVDGLITPLYNKDELMAKLTSKEMQDELINEQELDFTEVWNYISEHHLEELKKAAIRDFKNDLQEALAPAIKNILDDEVPGLFDKPEEEKEIDLWAT